MNKESKERIGKNVWTTAIGIVALIIAISMFTCKILFILGKLDRGNFNIVSEIVPLLFIAYAFIMAKDSLLGGMFGIITKLFIKK